MTGYELDALEQGERVALSRQPRACDCQLGTFCHLHAPEPSDLLVAAQAALRRPLDRRG